MDTQQNQSNPKLHKFTLEVSAILFKHDLMGINFGSNDDEYETEAELIVQKISHAENKEDVALIIYKVFADQFGNDLAKEKNDPLYDAMATEIWEAWENDLHLHSK